MASPEHRIFPYPLRGLTIARVDSVRCADITYFPLTEGSFYLVAVMARVTRNLLAWRLSNTMDTPFCIEALDEALARRRRSWAALATGDDLVPTPAGWFNARPSAV